MAEFPGHIAPEIVPDPHADPFACRLEHIEAKDAPILEAAVTAGVDYLLTLNSRDFTPAVAAASGPVIMRPGEPIERIRELVSAGPE